MKRFLSWVTLLILDVLAMTVLGLLAVLCYSLGLAIYNTHPALFWIIIFVGGSFGFGIISALSYTLPSFIVNICERIYKSRKGIRYYVIGGLIIALYLYDIIYGLATGYYTPPLFTYIVCRLIYLVINIFIIIFGRAALDDDVLSSTDKFSNGDEPVNASYFNNSQGQNGSTHQGYYRKDASGIIQDELIGNESIKESNSNNSQDHSESTHQGFYHKDASGIIQDDLKGNISKTSGTQNIFGAEFMVDDNEDDEEGNDALNDENDELNINSDCFDEDKWVEKYSADYIKIIKSIIEKYKIEGIEEIRVYAYADVLHYFLINTLLRSEENDCEYECDVLGKAITEEIKEFLEEQRNTSYDFIFKRAFSEMEKAHIKAVDESEDIWEYKYAILDSFEEMISQDFGKVSDEVLTDEESELLDYFDAVMFSLGD